MNRPRTHKIWADLWGNRARSLLVIASITVGLLTLGVITTLEQVLAQDMRAGYRRASPANIQISAQLFDDGLVEHLRQQPQIRQAEGLRLFSLRLEAAPQEWIAIDLRAAQDWPANPISQVRLVEGRWPPADHEIVIEQFKLKDTHARVGDLVTIETRSGQKRQLRLAGVVTDQTVGAFYGGAGFFLAPVQGYVTQETVKWLGESQPDRYNTLLLTVEGDPTGPANDEAYLHRLADAARDEIERVGGSVVSVGVRGSSTHPNQQYVDALSGVLYLLGLMVLFLSGFLITNTLQAIIQQQIQQIGILKTLGSHRAQIIALYMGLILVFGLLAAAIAVPLSQQLAFQRMGGLAAAVNIDYAGPRLVPRSIFLQVFMALIVPQAAALIPILQGSRISVSEALSGVRQGTQARRGWLDHQITRLRLLSRPTLIAVRNTFRRRGRTLLTLTTLSIGGAVFIATFNVQASMDQYVAMIGRYFIADVNLSLTTPRRVPEIEQELLAVPGVGRVEAWGAARCELIQDGGQAGATVQLLAPPAGSPLVDPVVLRGRWVQPGDHNAIALNERFLSDFPDLHVNDRLRLRVNGQESDWTVVGFFQLAGRNSGYLAYTSYESLSAQTNQVGQALSYRIVADRPNLPPAQQEALGRAIETHLEARGIQIADLTTGNSLSRSASQGFAVLTSFLLFLASLTAIVGSIGLAGAMSLNILERTREIGVLRAIGATNRILTRMVMIEGLLIGLLSWLIAVIIALPFSKVLSDSISQAIFGNASTLALDPRGFGLWLGIVLALSALASLLPARNAARLTIREVLAYE